MIPWELIGKTHVPGDRGELRLYRRAKEFSIRVNGSELMNSSAHASEDVLAEIACAKITERSCPRVLIGGLGMGYTLAAALRGLGPKARVVVAELVPELVVWNRGPLAALAGHPLEDTRVDVREADIALILQAERHAYDAILLDVDNGPEGLTRQANNWLYSRPGLDAAFATLRPAGVLAVWSAGPNRPFSRRLRQAGFKADEVRVRARSPHGGGRHTIWIAVRSS